MYYEGVFRRGDVPRRLVRVEICIYTKKVGLERNIPRMFVWRGIYREGWLGRDMYQEGYFGGEI